MIFLRIKEILIEELLLPEEEIKEDSHIVDDLGADSLDMVEIVMRIEEEFDMEIPDKEVVKLLKVKDFVDYLKEKE